MSSYDAIRRSGDRALVKVNSSLMKALDCEARSSQQGVCDAVRGAAKSTLGSLEDAPRAFDEKLQVIARRVACTGEGAKSDLLHTADWYAHADASSSWARSIDVPPTESIACPVRTIFVNTQSVVLNFYLVVV